MRKFILATLAALSLVLLALPTRRRRDAGGMDTREFAEIRIALGGTAIIIGARDTAIIIGVPVTVTVRHTVRGTIPDRATSRFGICGHGPADPSPQDAAVLALHRCGPGGRAGDLAKHRA